MNLRLFVLIVTLLISTINSKAQVELPDSLQNKLSHISSDTAKVTELLQYSRKVSRSNTKLNEVVLSYALGLAKQSGDERTISRVKVLIGQLLLYQNQFDSSRLLYSQALRIYKELNDSTNIGVALLEIGTVYYYEADDSSALNYYIQATKIFEALGDERRLGFIYNNVSNVYQYLGDIPSAIEYIQKAIHLKKKFGLDQALGSSYHNLGTLYSKSGELDKAVENFRISTTYKTRFNDIKGLATSYNSLAEIHFKQHHIDSSIFYHKKAIAADIALSDSLALAEDQLSFANTQYLIGNYREAIYLAQRVKSITKSAKIKERTLNLLAKNHEALKEFKQASKYYASYIHLHDSLTNSARTKAVDELKTKYETEKKEQQIAQFEQENVIQELEAGRQSQQRLFLAIASVLLLLALGLLYNRNLTKTKTNKLLDDKNKELASLNNTKDRLFSIISHDLKSPLSSFHTITKSLTDNWDSIEKDQLKEFILSLKDSSKEVHDMMDNLLRWALAQTGQLKYNPQSINAEKVINEVSNQLASPLLANKIQLTNETQSLEEINADNDFLKIIIRNLVSNAIKFSSMNSSIEILAEENDTSKIIAIRDYGVGIKSTDINKLFSSVGDVHYIKNSTNKGTGLGLVLCKELMEKMGGTIEVESEFEKGTTFRLIFPKAA